MSTPLSLEISPWNPGTSFFENDERPFVLGVSDLRDQLLLGSEVEQARSAACTIKLMSF